MKLEREIYLNQLHEPLKWLFSIHWYSEAWSNRLARDRARSFVCSGTRFCFRQSGHGRWMPPVGQLHLWCTGDNLQCCRGSIIHPPFPFINNNENQSFIANCCSLLKLPVRVAFATRKSDSPELGIDDSVSYDSSGGDEQPITHK